MPHAERLIAQSDVTLRAAARIRNGEAERLDLGVTFIATMAGVPEALKRLSDRHPALQLCVHEGLSGDLERDVLSGAVDLAVLHTPVSTPGIETIEAFREPYRLLVPHGHRLASKASVRIADIEGEKLILTSRDIGPVIYDRLIAMCRAAGVEPVMPHEMTTSLAVARMVAAGFGLGLAIGPAAQVARDMIVALEIEGDVPELVFALCYRPGTYGRYASELCAFLQEQQGPPP
ncbi:LysR family substrate-binding domain-containing protein [Tabrizicola sp.]|uniref:LysR family substrate-binding domain-containing protein n=1 Tax=Tabrizicola sp. TaxID=2005166 RepID=UPI003F307239